MRLARARIQNFRSLKDVAVDFGLHTAFVGGNGAGKSSILKAIEKFYATGKHLEPDDYYGRDLTEAVEIELTFEDLNEAELHTFESRVRDGRLSVTRVFDGTSSSGRYHGVVPQNPDFRDIRNQTAFAPKRALYNALRELPPYDSMPAAASGIALDEALATWEAAHPESLVAMPDNGQFFGFQNAGRGALQRHTSFVFIPAVREASVDVADSKASPVQQLLDLVVRSAILQKPAFVDFRSKVNAEYQEITSPENMPELGVLGERLTGDLQRLYENASLDLAWRPAGEMSIPLPAADVSLAHDGFGGPVDRQGHGLQRALIFTLLQHLARTSQEAAIKVDAEAQVAAEDGGAVAVVATAPSVILAIEEPELYQHPTKQRHLATVLRKLSEGALPGASGPTQIAFASHSPLFVSMPHVDEIRFVRRVDCDDGGFKQCEMKALDLAAVAARLQAISPASDVKFTADSLQARLHILGPELSEGFFADAVVLVEGRSDKAALIGVAERLGVSFEAAGIAVLSAEGKSCLDKPLLIFTELGIPVYPIWDCDADKKPVDCKPLQNLALLRAADPGVMHDEAPGDTRVTPRYACFGHNLETTLKSEITPETYTTCLDAVSEQYGATRGDAQKNPEMMKSLLALAAEKDARSMTLETIVRTLFATLKGVVVP